MGISTTRWCKRGILRTAPRRVFSRRRLSGCLIRNPDDDDRRSQHRIAFHSPEERVRIGQAPRVADVGDVAADRRRTVGHARHGSQHQATMKRERCVAASLVLYSAHDELPRHRRHRVHRQAPCRAPARSGRRRDPRPRAGTVAATVRRDVPQLAGRRPAHPGHRRHHIGGGRFVRRDPRAPVRRRPRHPPGCAIRHHGPPFDQRDDEHHRHSQRGRTCQRARRAVLPSRVVSRCCR